MTKENAGFDDDPPSSVCDNKGIHNGTVRDGKKILVLAARLLLAMSVFTVDHASNSD